MCFWERLAGAGGFEDFGPGGGPASVGIGGGIGVEDGAAAVALGAEGGGGGDLGALLEGEGVADGVEFGGGLDPKQAAEVEEVLLAGGLLGEVGFGPLLDEGRGVHVGGV